jgi:hypothetical protein
MDAVVPVAVEFMALEIDAGEVGGGDFDAGRIRIGVDLGTDLGGQTAPRADTLPGIGEQRPIRWQE